MPSERDYYKHFRVICPACDTLTYCRTLPIVRPTTMLVVCPNCRNDICLAVIPDISLDGANQQNGYHAVQLIDLIYLESGLTEEEGDRLLWANKNTLENRIVEYKRQIAGAGPKPAENAG